MPRDFLVRVPESSALSRFGCPTDSARWPYRLPNLALAEYLQSIQGYHLLCQPGWMRRPEWGSFVLDSTQLSSSMPLGAFHLYIVILEIICWLTAKAVMAI